MRAVRSIGNGRVAVIDCDGPSDPGFDDPVLVKVRCCGICGSDLHLIQGKLPFTLGHEFAGVLEDGTCVAVQPFTACGSCDRCCAGVPHQCRRVTKGLHGIHLDGGLADEVIVERSCLVALPAGVSVRDAGLVEPLAVAVRTLLTAGLVPHGGAPRGPILVVGGGSIGLAVVAVARHWGIDADLVARHVHQHEAGERLGARFALRDEYQISIEAAGSQSAIDQAISSTAPGGTVIVPGTYWTPVAIGMTFQVRSVSLVPSMMYGADDGVRDFDLAADVLAGSPDIVDALVTHRFGLDDAPEAFRVAADRSAGALKVHVLV